MKGSQASIQDEHIPIKQTKYYVTTAIFAISSTKPSMFSAREFRYSQHNQKDDPTSIVSTRFIMLPQEDKILLLLKTTTIHLHLMSRSLVKPGVASKYIFQ
jgi:hypothetical protein